MNRMLPPLLTLLLLLTACKDGTGPAPVATTLDISPATLTLGVGESMQLQAQVLDQNGRPMSGQTPTITWSSSDSSVVGIDASGLARGLRLGSATVTARSGTLQGSAPAEVLGPRVQRQENARASATMGPVGGTLVATAADGTRYTLTIPAGALQQEREIALTPLAGIARLPGEAQMAAGAQFAPEGLVLYRAATLEIELPAGRSAAGLFGFAYQGEGEDLHLTPMQADGRRLTLRVTHFSGSGAVAPPTPWTPPVPGSPEAQARQALALLLAQAAPDMPDPAAMAAILRAWYVDVVRPSLAAAGVSAGTEYATYLAAVRDHGSWDDMLLLLGVALHDEQAEARALHVPMLRTAIDYANQRCLAEQALLRAAQALWLQDRARDLSLDRFEDGLDRATVLQTLCVNPVFEHVMLLQALEPGGSAQLSVLAGYGFGAGATRFDVPFHVQVEATTQLGTVLSAGTTDASGRYQGTVSWPPGTPRLTIRVTVCLRSAFAILNDLCRQDTLERGGGPVEVRVTCRISRLWALALVEFVDQQGRHRDATGDQQVRELVPPGDCRPGEPVDLRIFSHSLSTEAELTYTTPGGVSTTGSADASITYTESITGSAEGAPGLSVVQQGTSSTDAAMQAYSAGRWALARGQAYSELGLIFEVHGAAIGYTLDASVGPGLCVWVAGTTWEGESRVVAFYCAPSSPGSVQLAGTLDPGEYFLRTSANAARVHCHGSGCATSPTTIPPEQDFSLSFRLEPQPEP